MEKFIVERTEDKDIEFEGKLVAVFKSQPHYAGIGHSVEFNLFKTRANKYVCQKKHLSQWPGCGTTYEAIIGETEEEVIAFFGLGEGGKKLYEIAGITATEKVE